MSNHNRRKRKFNLISFIILISITSTLQTNIITTDQDINSLVISKIQFTKNHYTGYISENVAAVKQFNHNDNIQSSRLNARTRSISKPYIYIRFIDLIKPSLTIHLNETNKCSKLALNKLNLDLLSSDDDLFVLDLETQCFNLNQTLCECPIRIRLKDDSSRDRLNREAQDIYMLQLNLVKHSLISSISIKILDDNDLEPMFDPSEYLITLNDTQKLTAFTKIGKVVARDPDLSRNSIVRYFINCNQFNNDLNSYSSSEDLKESQLNQININCNKYFGVDWLTGDIYIKKSLDLIYEHLFEDQNDENELEIKLEIKAVDTGLKLNIANNFLNQPVNNQKYRHLNRTMRRYKSFDYDDDQNDDLELKNADFKEDDLINYKLIKSAANLKPTSQIKSISINNNNNNNNNNRKNIIYYGTSLEAALVRIKLQRASFKPQIKFTKLSQLDNAHLNEQIKFKLDKYSNSIIPFGLIESNESNLDLGLKITNDYKLNNFKIEKIYLNSESFNYLVFIQPTYSDLVEFKSLLEMDTSSNQMYSIRRCHLTRCSLLAQFEFNLTTDLVDLIEHLCSIIVYLNENNTYKLNKYTSLNSTLFKLNYKFNSIYSNDLCENLLLTKNRLLNESLFHMEYDLLSPDSSIHLDKTTGIARLVNKNQASPNKLTVYANFYFKNLKLKSFTSNQLTLTIQQENNDQIELTNLFASTPFSLKHFNSQKDSIEMIQLKLIDSIIKQNETIFKFNSNQPCMNVSQVYCSLKPCPFQLDPHHLTLISILVLNKTTFDSVDLIFKLTSGDLVKLIKFKIEFEHERFEHENCSIRISLNQEQFNNDSFTQLNIFLIKMNVLNDLNQTGEYRLSYLNNNLEKCVLINPKSGNILLKCKTQTFLKQYQMSQEITVRIEYKQAITYLHFLFDMTNQHNLSDVTIFNCNRAQNIPFEINQELKQVNLKKTHYVNSLKDLKQNMIIFDLNENDIDLSILSLNEEFYLIEEKSQLFQLCIVSGSLRLARDWDINFIDLFKNHINSYDYETRLKTSKSNYLINVLIEIVINKTSLMSQLNKINLPEPRLSQYNYEFNININDLIKHQDYILLNQIDTYLIGYDNKLNSSDLYTLGYSIRLTNINNLDLPFYVDSNGKLFYSNLNDDYLKSNKYDFSIVVTFKLNDLAVHEQSAHCRVNIHSSLKHKIKPINNYLMNKNITLGGQLDLSMSIISADFISNLQCSLIGFFNMESKTSRTQLKLLKPKLKTIKLSNKKNNQIRFGLHNSSKKSAFQHKRTSISSMEEYVFNLSSEDEYANDDFEQKLLFETFYSQLYLDESTGALYFNLNDNHDSYSLNQDSNEFTPHKTQLNQPVLYSKLAKLISFYLYERNQASKRVRVDAYISSSDYLITSNQTQSIWIDLIFKKSFKQLLDHSIQPVDLINHVNKFQINSNNLLNLFNNGDEFSLEISVEENYNQSDFLNLRKYFESKLDLKRNFINLKLIKQLEYYLVDLEQYTYLGNSFLTIDDVRSGILNTKSSVQFDYEVEQNHLSKIMIVQQLNQDEIESDVDKFVYWLDLSINVLNQIDEPLVCEEPIYFIDIDENELKNKKLFTVNLKDYDADSSDTSSRVYKSQIVSGNAQGLFNMNDLSLYTGSSARKLDRETRQQHELDIKITETILSTNQSRHATCKLVINLNDINDNRPIINDIELVIYNKLDVKLVEEANIPIANAIAIDPDQISKLTYTIASVRYLTNKNKRSEDDEQSGSDEIKPFNQQSAQSSTNTDLTNLFSLNSTNGNLYALKTEMPCVDCTILVQYRANDIGRLKTRVSRKSTIKFHIKPIPVSLFKINNDDELLQSQTVHNSSILKTFDLNLVNSTESNKVILTISEDTKLGEKLYQIKIKNKQIKNELTLVYFCLIDSNDSNQTFYMSNHDGSLYLIKHLDYEAVKFYNLTILLTNWLGQQELVNIQINVKDINDNRPQFESTLIVLNESINLNNEETKISLVTAFDQDDLDEGKLVFKLEDCFYTSKNLLLKKNWPINNQNDETNNLNHLIYPLCSKQFIEIIDEWFQFNKKQAISLKINLNNLNLFLQNSSSFYLKQLEQNDVEIGLILDISVRDQSLTSLTRVNLNLNLKSNKQPKQINKQQSKPIDSRSQIKYGFRKQNYFVQIKSREQLTQQIELIRLYNEFGWTQANSTFNLFKPFELNFKLLTNNLTPFKIESNFGTVYYDSNNKISDFIYKLTIGCDVNLVEDDDSNEDDSINLFKITNLIISIESQALYPNDLIDDLVYYPIWSQSKLDAYIYENLPPGTWLTNSNNLLFTLKDYLNWRTIHNLVHILPSQNIINSLQFVLNDDYFDLDQLTGFIRSKIETDYEIFTLYDVHIQICLVNLDQIISTNKLCFKQLNHLRIHILNKNDNEPKIIKKSSDLMLDLYNTSELIRSMSLFKFKADDADQSTNQQLDYKLIQVKSLVLSQNRCNDLQPGLDWFDLFTLDEMNQCIQLTDLGYESLIKLVSRTNECHYSIELIVRVTDGLFTNHFNYYFNLLFSDSSNSSTYSPLLFIKSGLVAPIFNSIEFNENINTNSSELLVNLNDLLTKYLSSINLNPIEHVEFDLKNYENYFYLNHTDNQLYIRKGAKFDREQRDSFELFLKVKHLTYPVSYFRILIKLNDFNDNPPVFYQPNQLRHLSPNLYELNQTFTFSDLLQTNKTNPLLVIKASDVDSGLNGLIKYELLDDVTFDLLKINERSGALYLNSKLNSSTLWKKYALNQYDFTLKLAIQAQDQNQFDKHKSILFVNLIFINLTQNENVYFNKSFYEFTIYESSEPNSLIGYVNTLVKLNHTSSFLPVYTLIDDSNQFEIDHLTGGLYLRSKLDYEHQKKYNLIVSVYNTFDLNVKRYSNATVEINVLNVNDNEPKFSSYEYQIEINENIAKMSPIFQVNATDLDYDGLIKYQLLNHLDKFYIDEQTGIIYNKVTFDYESMYLDASQDSTNTSRYSSFEYLNLIQLKIRALDRDGLESDCILTIKIINTNDNLPQFERAVFTTSIQISDNENDSNTNETILNYLLKTQTNETSLNSLQFVTKITAKDIDSKQLFFSIVKQTQIEDDSNEDKIKLNHLAVNSLFQIENTTGLVYVDLIKFKLLKKLSHHYEQVKQIKLKQFFTFSLQLAVSDLQLTSYARLTVQIESIVGQEQLNLRPHFKTNLINLGLNITKLNLKRLENSSLLNLNKHLAFKSNSFVNYSLNLNNVNEIFSIKSNRYLFFNLKRFNDLLKLSNQNLNDLVYQLPVSACNTIQTGLCDQVLIRVNLTDLVSNKRVKQLVNETKSEQISFAYEYASVTIQQQQQQQSQLNQIDSDLDSNTTSNEDDYDFDYNYEANERFYFEIKTTNQLDDDFESQFDADFKQKQNYEFELFSCVYSTLNVTYANSSLGKQIKQFVNQNNLYSSQSNHHRLTVQQLKSLFSLNKHNGVLSSRKIINSMLPGVYLFNIRLRTNTTQSSEAPYELLDSTQFKLIILPPNNHLKSNFKNLHNYFKFNREYYKFKLDKQHLDELGQIKLVTRSSKQLTRINYNLSYLLIESKQTKSILNLIDLNPTNGLLRIKNVSLLDSFKPFLKNDLELTVYALALVNINTNSTRMNNNTLEYMCEIIIDFKSVFNSVDSSENYLNQLVDKNGEFIKFGRDEHVLKLFKSSTNNSKLALFRFLAFMHTTERNLSIQYSIETEQNKFQIDTTSGILYQRKQLNSNEFKLKIKACVINELGLVLNQIECALTTCLIQLMEKNDNPPKFEQLTYDETIREDVLPGTVVTTVVAHDSDSSKLDYFILNGDDLNQFAVSTDGKVYTRLMLDREIKQSYKLIIMAFDGRYKSITLVNINVLDINDNRPQCNQTLVKLNLSELTQPGTLIYQLNTSDLDTSSSLIYEIITKEENNLIDQINLNRTNSNRVVRERIATSKEMLILPFGINDKLGQLKLVDQLDFESQQYYEFYIRVVKANEQQTEHQMRSILKSSKTILPWSTYCLIKFEIKILDENDNPPVFNQLNKKSVNLIEHSPSGSIVTRIKTTDADSSNHSRINYSILNDLSNMFEIDSKSGLITLISDTLDRELLGNKLNLTIQANDSKFITDLQVEINIQDINDNKPIFNNSILQLNVDENTSIGTVIARIRAQDMDLNSTTFYEIISKTNEFLINRTTGDLIVNTKLDYETNNRYLIQIEALDPNNFQAKSIESLISVQINLNDINDNIPQFNQIVNITYVDENTPVNTTLLELNAFDHDSTRPNNEIEFQIRDGNYLNYFDIDKVTGQLINRIQFDYELLQLRNELDHELTIECSDKGVPVLKNLTKVKISIRNLNDNVPQFQRKNQTIVIKENHELNSPIVKLQVNDLDFNEFKFEIINQQQQMFNIDSNGSLILLEKPVNNQIYTVQVRCYDSGKPVLYSDSYLTIKITDDQSNEPKLNNTQIEIITISDLIKIDKNTVLANIHARDPDNDKLIYSVSDLSSFKIDKHSGYLTTLNDLNESTLNELKLSVTDNKFTIESDLTVHVKNIQSDCFTNSLFIKFNVWKNQSEKIRLEEFYELGYMKRFKEMLVRILNTNKNNYEFGSRLNSYNRSNVLVMALRHVDLDTTNLEDETNLEPQQIGSIVEILFSIRKQSHKDETNECLDSKLVSKMLNKRRATIIKRMRVPFHNENTTTTNANMFKFKLVDLSFNSQCKLDSKLVCTTNVALQNCVLKLKGYYEPNSLCETDDDRINTDTCYLIPKYEWFCDILNDLSHNNNDDLKSSDNSFNLFKISNKTKTDNKQNINEKYGSSCKKPFNPCKNNGICKQVKVGSLSLKKSSGANYKLRIHCFCPNGFKGAYCEEDIDECNELDSTTDGPCIQGAKCQNTYGSYICNCTSHPPSNCYNTLSPQYSASTIDKKLILNKNHKYSNYAYNSDKKKYEKLETKSESELLKDDDIYIENDSDDDEINDYLLFGSISTSTVKQALLGVFGAVCGILIILTLAAAVMCKMNISSKRLKKRYLNETELQNEKMSSLLEATQSHTDSGDGLSDNHLGSSSSASSNRSNNSSPVSFNKDKLQLNQIQKIEVSSSSNEIINHYGCGGSSNVLIKTSTQSTSGGFSLSDESNHQIEHRFKKANKATSNRSKIELKKNKYTINNLLFAKLNSQKVNTPLLSSGSQATSSICESLASSVGCSPGQTNHKNETNNLLNKNNDINIYESDLNDLNETYKLNSKYLLNGMSSFGRNSSKKQQPTIGDIELKLRDSFYKYDSICSLSSKDNKADAVLVENKNSPFKYNTSSLLRPKPNTQSNYYSLLSKQTSSNTNTTTFVPIQNKDINDERDDSTLDDNTQGFYWDVTDWAGSEIDTQKMKKKLKTTKTDLLPSITSHLPQLIMHQLTATNSDSNQTLNSPIYSSNFKSQVKSININEDLINNNNNNDDFLKETSTLINFEISSNYLYLVNTDLCNNDDDTLPNNN